MPTRKHATDLSVDKNVRIAPFTYSTVNFCGFSGSLLMEKICKHSQVLVCHVSVWHMKQRLSSKTSRKSQMKAVFNALP